MLKPRKEPKRIRGTITEERAYCLCHGEIVVEFVRRMNDACEVEYLLHPDWETIDRLTAEGNMPYFFPGLSIIRENRREEYVKDHLPTFIRKNVPPKGRIDIPEICKRVGYPPNTEYDPWLFILTTHAEAQFGGITIYRKEELQRMGLWRGKFAQNN